MVLLISYSGAFGGAERLLLQFAQGVERRPELACPEGALAGAARDQGVTVWPLPHRSLAAGDSATGRVRAASRLAAHGHEIRRLVRELDPALVIAWGMRSAIATLIGPSLRRPVVFQHNDLLPGAAISHLVRAAARRAELTIALSETIAVDLDPTRRLGDRLTVVHPGVDVARFDPGREPAQPPEVLMLGALVGWKRPDLALETCALARRNHPDMRLRLVGSPLQDGDEGLTSALRARASMPDLDGVVEFAGAVDDPRPELARATLLLHCAEREPFGMAVLEALAAGRAVVAPAAAGCAEIVDSACGLLYEPGDARAAAAAVSELLSDPDRAARLGEAGQRRARSHFDFGAAQERYRQALRPLLGSGATRSRGVALVTVTHNSAPELRGLLSSRRRHLPGVPLIVVDCGSEDESVAIAREAEGVEVLALADNLGFGRGCNVGLEAVREPVTALVNPDVELIDDSLLALAAEAERTDRPERLLAPLVLYPDGNRQDSVHPMPTSPPDLVRAVVPPAVVPGPLRAWLAPWRSTAPRRVGWAVGCALVARSETLLRLGPFDQRIFLYGEDLDLGLRAAELGIETWFWPAARVLHRRAASATRSFGAEQFELLARTRREVIGRRLGARRMRLDDAAQTVTFASRALVKWAIGHDAQRERRQLEGLRRVRR